MNKKKSQKVLFFHEFEIGQAILFYFQFGIFFFFNCVSLLQIQIVFY